MAGYILAGLTSGPLGLAFADYSNEISSLAEFGVILLLFIIGIESLVMAFLRALLPAMIAASLHVSPLWSGMFYSVVISYRIHDPTAPPSNQSEPK